MQEEPVKAPEEPKQEKLEEPVQAPEEPKPESEKKSTLPPSNKSSSLKTL